jgi:ferritin
MFSQTLQEALNEQLKHELYSSYLYLSMAAYCDSLNLPGFAHWMLSQSREEYGHAMRLFKFINERRGRIVLQTIDQPPSDYKSAHNVFDKALEHERLISGMINDLYALAVQEKDYATQVFLQWFVTEQVEEEQSVAQIVETLKLVGDKTHALLLVDRELGGRRDH